ncbi:hypothetical protein CPB85DRAFT_1435132 [Mucidula mucida]|nr:hypothetical protein CPB85DRAFT_1435132 [Mucidula mucida]
MQVLSPVSSRSPSPISDPDTDPGSFNYLSIPVATAPSLTEVSPIWDRHRARSPSTERSNSERSLSPPEIINISPPSSANSTKAPSPALPQSRVFSPSVGPASVLCSPAPSFANSLRSLSATLCRPKQSCHSVHRTQRAFFDLSTLSPTNHTCRERTSESCKQRSSQYPLLGSKNMVLPVQVQHRPIFPKRTLVLESPRFDMNSGSPLTPPSSQYHTELCHKDPGFGAFPHPPPEPIPYRTLRSSIQPIPYKTWVCRPATRQEDMSRHAFVGSSGSNNPTKPVRNPWGPPPTANHFEPSSPLSQTVSPSTSSGADSYFPCSPGLFGARSPPPVPVSAGLFGPRSPLPPPPVPVQWKMTLPTPPPANHSSYAPRSIFDTTCNFKTQPPRTCVPPSSYPVPNASYAAAANAMNSINEMTANMSAALGYQAVRPHERFYFNDGTAWIRVKNIDYKVHRHFLTQHSSFFRTQYSGVGLYSNHSNHTNSNPLNPLSLPDIDTAAFDLVLSIFYPKDPFSGHDIQTPAQWGQVLRFACEYDMQSIREMALTKVAALTPLERVDLAKQYKLKEIMVPSFVDLYLEDVELSKEDGKKIGWEGLLVLAEVKREVESNVKAFLDHEKVTEVVDKKLGEMGLLD